MIPAHCAAAAAGVPFIACIIYTATSRSCESPLSSTPSIGPGVPPVMLVAGAAPYGIKLGAYPAPPPCTNNPEGGCA